MAKYVQPTFIVDSSASFLGKVAFDSSVFLKGSTFISSPVSTTGTPFALVVDTIGDRILVKSIQLGTMATKQSASYDASIAKLIAKDAFQDSSIGWLDTNLLHLSGGTLTGLLTLAATGFTLDGQNITNIDTSADGLGVGLDTHIPTSAAVKAAIEAGIASGVTANNGLTESPIGNFQLGGALIKATTITTTNASTLTIAGLSASTGLLAVIAPGGVLKTQQLGTMALETATNYTLKTLFDSSLGAVWTKFGSVDTSLANLGTKNANQDTSLNSIWTKLGYVDTSLAGQNSWNISQDASIVDLRAAGTRAWNGLTTTNSSVGLGGALNIATTITTSATNTLSLAGLQTSSDDTALALVQDDANGPLKVRALGSMAWATTTNYTLKTLFDSSLGAVWTKFGYVDTSLNGIWSKLGNHDTSLNGIWTKFGYVDTSMATMNTWNINQDTSIANISAVQGNYVLKAGDTMTGPLSITAGGLSVTNNASIGGGLSIIGDTYIGGTLTIDGSLYVRSTETIDVSSAYIRLNTGMTGAPPAYMQSGIIIERGSASPYVFLYDENLQTFRIGIANDASSFADASTQAVATREDTPTAFGVPFYNGNKFRFDTSAGLTFTPGVGLGLPIATNMAAEATALVWNGTTVGSRELGTMAFETSTNYYGKTAVNGLISDLSTLLDTRLDFIDTSIAGLNTLTIVHTAGILDLSTNAIRAVANVANGGTASIFSYENNNTAYLKKLLQGTGITITEDTSTITIASAGALGYVSKYKGTFDGTAASPFSILAATHGLGVGPLTVAVYESLEQVYTGVTCSAIGDVTLTWTAGSLTDASCKFVITG